MDHENLPVQVIVHCGAGGELKPLRFQYEDAAHQVHTIHVDQVTDSRKVELVGIEAMLYLCKGQEYGKEHLYELRYTIATHKWVMFRQVY